MSISAEIVYHARRIFEWRFAICDPFFPVTLIDKVEEIAGILILLRSTIENQLHCFESILSRCASDNKLMTVHIRNAEEEAIRIIRKYAPKKCIIHWFTGTDEQMIKLLDLGCFMSVNSNMVVSHNKSKYLKIPTDRILIESDGPYTRVFGKRYTPDLLSQSYKLISEFYENSDLITIAYKNFKDVLKK